MKKNTYERTKGRNEFTYSMYAGVSVFVYGTFYLQILRFVFVRFEWKLCDNFHN